ncbi:collagen alpha-5(VI) chain-like [Saccostrea echinata]|uniref:collagen alpha-5(VI) chain-like n=1 Tax=Saccostrea echinata TaxID=191078 RepID=UPI002A817A6E|nr:collagen alpha-5(VI) chain-like [Saccostrea echinata]
MLTLILVCAFISLVFGHGDHQHSLYYPEVSEHEAKSFLHKRHAGHTALSSTASPDPAYCTQLLPGYETWCELHIPYCQEQQEYTREQRCATLTTPCAPGQFCMLTTPCPAHFAHACVDINECDSNPCQNGGTCHDGISKYTCTCLPGWTGTNCEIDIDECLSFPCMYGNDCIEDRINSYKCVCSERYEGVHCETDCRPGPVDVMFLVDTSWSQSEAMNRSIAYMTKFIKHVPIGSYDFQVSLVSFASKPELVFNFTAYRSNSSLLDAVSFIRNERGATKTSDALSFISQEILNPANGARLLSNISHYVVLLTDGLSTDRAQAIQRAQILKATYLGFKIFVVGVGEDIGHEELVQLSTDPSYTFAPDNDDLLFAMLKDATDYGCTDCNSSSVTDVVILFDTSKDSSPLVENSLHSLKVVEKLFDSFDTTNTNVSVAMMTYSNDTQIQFDFHQRSIPDTKAKLYTVSIEDKKGNTAFALSRLQDELFNRSSTGSRPNARKICYLFTNGNWAKTDILRIKQQIVNLHNDGISVNIMVPFEITDSGLHRTLENAKEAAFDPYRVYMIEDNGNSISMAVKSAARDTKYVECPPNIFDLKN